MANFGKAPPSIKIQLKPFEAHVDEQKLQDFKQLLKLSPIAPPVYENSDKSVERRYGVTRDWLIAAKDHWLNKFDWRAVENHINSFPNFTASVDNDVGGETDIHFIALFSQKPDAIPLVFYHGWPGSFLEFVPILELLKKKYSPADLPYHVIVPSLPGYTYSGGPPLDRDYGIENAAACLNNLMLGLGFESGYLAQGGDLGSFISRIQAARFDACKGMHLNFSPMPRPKNANELPIDEIEGKALPRAMWFREQGSAYALEHGTRTATIGYALSASPISLLAWIGEKFQEWTDEDLPLDTVLEDVTLYWLTDTFPRCIYPYRGLAGDDERPRIGKASGGRPAEHVSKPSGYSFFPKELMPMPKSWVGTNANLIFTATHTSGGHFAALEKPQELLADVEEYVAKAWKGREGKL